MDGQNNGIIAENKFSFAGFVVPQLNYIYIYIFAIPVFVTLNYNFLPVC